MILYLGCSISYVVNNKILAVPSDSPRPQSDILNWYFVQLLSLHQQHPTHSSDAVFLAFLFMQPWCFISTLREDWKME